MIALRFDDLKHPDEDIITDIEDIHVGDFLVRKTNKLDFGPIVYYYQILDISATTVTIMYHGKKTELVSKPYIDGKSIWLTNDADNINLKLRIRMENMDTTVLTRL